MGQLFTYSLVYAASHTLKILQFDNLGKSKFHELSENKSYMHQKKRI